MYRILSVVRDDAKEDDAPRNGDRPSSRSLPASCNHLLLNCGATGDNKAGVVSSYKSHSRCAYLNVLSCWEACVQRVLMSVVRTERNGTALALESSKREGVIPDMQVPSFRRWVQCHQPLLQLHNARPSKIITSSL